MIIKIWNNILAVPDSVSVITEITSHQNMPIFLPKSIDTDVELKCTVILKSEIDIPVTVQTDWSRKSSFRTNLPASMDTLNTYSSMITIRSINISDAGDYKCRATVSKTPSGYITGEGKNETSTTLSLCKPFISQQNSNLFINFI